MAADPGDHFDGVVFDLDGVLVESEHLWEENWTQHAAANDYTWLATDTATVQGMSVPEWSGYMAERIGRGRPEEIAEAVIDGMIGALHGGRVDLLPGAPEMVAAAADRVPIAVASSAPRRLIDGGVGGNGSRTRISPRSSPARKFPAASRRPTSIWRRLDRLVCRPQSCAAVEDSSNGIRAAAAAGMTVIAIPNSVYPPKAGRPGALCEDRPIARGGAPLSHRAATRTEIQCGTDAGRNRVRGSEEQRTMKRMLNEASAFREEMIAGYASAYGRYLQRVPGASGVMANGTPAPGRVSVVVGGGSGHYPAFYGLVGHGLASAAAIGDIFTSPSGEQCYRVAKAVDGGAGILFTFGNYSGDVMNFGMAEGRLRAEGVDARTVLVTDDVLSASREEADRRRGIAGGFFVFKSAGASAARGDSLDDVEALTRHANSRVRTAGIAFAGCTVPGQDQPLFSVAPGQMEIGLGIHGEPGVRVAEQMPAREIAAMLVETLLAETPEDAGSDVAVLVNGLGGTKYEEMFVFYNDVAALLDRSGLSPYNPLIGEFVTSLDMTGMSLSLLWLDDDLKSLLDATASSPAFTSIGPDVAQATESATSSDRDSDGFHRGGRHLRGGRHPRRRVR